MHTGLTDRTVKSLLALLPLTMSAGCASTGLNQGIVAPDFRLTSLDDQQVVLSDFRGEVVLLNFWASW